jgi:cysteinyl-tRNA synthetase
VDDAIEEWATVASDLKEALSFPAYGIEQEVDVTVYRDRFLAAMDNDLDTPAAIEALVEIGQLILEAPEDEDIREAQATLRELGEILGLTFSD